VKLILRKGSLPKNSRLRISVGEFVVVDLLACALDDLIRFQCVEYFRYELRGHWKVAVTDAEKDTQTYHELAKLED